jgi:glycerophosphoryl diester phosphodiesterase
MIASERPYLRAGGTLAFAHRGGSLEHPENTMVAFGSAVDLGYLHLETDTQLTRDGVLLAFHDQTLDRVSDLSGPVSGRTLGEIRRADAAHRFSLDGGRTHPLRGTGIGIPTLEEVLVSFPQTGFNIDAKTSRVLVPLAALIERLGAADRICIGSYSDGRLRRFRRLSGGGVCTSMGRDAIVTARLTSLAGRMPAFGADCVQVPVSQWGVRVADRAFVRAAHRGGLQVHVWTIDDRAEMERLLDLEVDGIMSDRPALLKEVLQARGLWAGAEMGGQRDLNPRPPDPQSGALTN